MIAAMGMYEMAGMAAANDRLWAAIRDGPGSITRPVQSSRSAGTMSAASLATSAAETMSSDLDAAATVVAGFSSTTTGASAAAGLDAGSDTATVVSAPNLSMAAIW